MTHMVNPLKSGHKYEFPGKPSVMFLKPSCLMLEIWLFAYFRLFAYHFAVPLHQWSKHTLLSSLLFVVVHSAFFMSSAKISVFKINPLPNWQLSNGISRFGPWIPACALGTNRKWDVLSDLLFAKKKPRLSDKWQGRTWAVSYWTFLGIESKWKCLGSRRHSWTASLTTATPSPAQTLTA